MKTGILSMHRVNNYGSFWQAYCLKKMIECCGSDADFIDIKKGKQFLDSEPYKPSFSFSKIKRIPYYIFQKKKANMFKVFQNQKLGCAETYNYSNDYDCIIIGSDEVFNCVQQSPWGFTSQLYGDIENDNVNSYAGSFGYTTIQDLEKYDLKEKVKEAFCKLNNISVRDSNSEQIAIELMDGKMIHRHLDPVLIGDLPVPEKQAVKDKYILIYAYDFRFNDKEYIQTIKEYAKKNNLKIYSVGFYQDWVDRNILTDPYGLLSFFKNAEYIVTDTFHGTIFSVRCEKPFLTIVRNTNTQKLTSLLECIGLSGRILKKACDFEKIENYIDYGAVFDILDNEKNRSLTYIEKCLKGEIFLDEQ